jgi:hypothetical protein
MFGEEYIMRKVVQMGTVLGVVLTFTGLGRAADDAQAILDKALKAHGGLEKLAKLKSSGVQSKAKGQVNQLGGIDITMEIFGQDGKFKHIIRGEVMGNKFTQTQVFNGENFWININGQEIPFGDEKVLAEIKEQVYTETVVGLAFLKKGKFELSPLGEIKVDDRPALGVRVSSKGHRDVNLYFDKEKGLLVKTETRTMDVQSKEERTEEKILRDYKEFEGNLVPTRILVNHDGKKALELEIEEVKIVEKFEDGTFAKP